MVLGPSGFISGSDKDLLNQIDIKLRIELKLNSFEHAKRRVPTF
jgi:hypothetical protein